MTSTSSLPYRSEIDGLRAVMMLIVIFGHAFPDVTMRKHLPGTFLSIDVFFVISGFLMTKILCRSLENGTFSFRNFFRRRVLRIFPIFFITQLTGLVIACLFYYPDELNIVLSEVTAGSFLVANWQTMKDILTYNNLELEFLPYVHLWTLAIEEQFYLFIPVVLWTGRKLRLNLQILLGILTLLSLGACFYYYQSRQVGLAFFSFQTRIWEILAGGVISFYPLSVRRRELLSLSGLALFLFALFFIHQRADWNGAEIVAIAGGMLLIISDSGAWVHRKIFSQPILTKLGLMLYSTYLWHWPILSIPRILMGEELSVGLKYLLIALTILLGWATWKYIELPIRKSGRPWVWIILLFSLGVSSFFIQKYALSGKRDAIAEISNARDCSHDPEISAIGNISCLSSQRGKSDSLLLGDEHAMDKFYGLNLKDQKRYWSSLTVEDCAPVMGITDRERPECQLVTEKMYQWVTAQKEIKTVVIGFFHDHYLHQKRFGSTRWQGKETLYLGLKNAVALLQKAGKKVILLKDVPFFPFSRNDCLRKNHCSVTKKLIGNYQKAQEWTLSNLTEEFPGTISFNPFPIFCQGEKCSIKKDNILLFNEMNRLNQKGSEIYAEAFLKETGL